jgi:hypothetical protein
MALIYDAPVNQVELTLLEALINDDLEWQKFILRARSYYNGDQITFLTERMREYLNLNSTGQWSVDDFHLNIIQTVVIAVLDELSVIGFDTSEKANAGGAKPQAQWAREVWDANKMGILQHNIHEAALRDSESFIMVDFDETAKLPRMTWHEKFMDGTGGGDGYGVWFKYPENDWTQEPLAAVKEWKETSTRNGMPYTYRRRNVYYPDRIEKYYRDPDWKPYIETDESENGEPVSKAWPTPWVNAKGEPLGIPVIRFSNFGNAPEAKEAFAGQDAVNKLFLDVLGEADGAFRIYFLKGAHATTDGKPLDSNESNRLNIAPMTVLSTTNTDADLKALEGGDPTKLMTTLKEVILIVAQITGTPVSYFTITKQIAGVDTLKGQDKPLSKKVEKRKDIFGQSWADVMSMARRIANTFGAAGLDETAQFYTIWKQVFDLETIKMMRETLELPKETLWRLYGLSEEQITAAKETDEYKSVTMSLRMQEIELEQMEAGRNNTESKGV